MAARAIEILSPAPVKKVLKRARPSPLNEAVKRKLILKVDQIRLLLRLVLVLWI